MNDAFTDLQKRYRKFVDERGWARFHTPKNIAAALSVEASELLEIFMWLKEDAPLSPERLQNAKDEMGDVLLYLVRLADLLNIDLAEAVEQKFEKVHHKYTIEKAKAFTKTLDA